MAEQYFVSRVCEGQKQIYKRPWYIVEKKNFDISSTLFLLD